MELNIHAVKAKYLPDLRYTYLKFILVKKTNEKKTSIFELETRVIDMSNDPEWDEKFVYDLPSIENSYLQVYLMNRDTAGIEFIFYEFEIPLEKSPLGEIYKIDQKLPKAKRAKHSPIIFIELFICKKGMTPWVSSPFQLDKLIITAIEGKELPKMDFLGTANGYLSMHMFNSTKKYMTKVYNNSYEPIWNETFTIYLMDRTTDVLQIALKNDHRILGDETISNYEIKISDLTPDEEIDQWYDFIPTNDMKKLNKSGGYIHLKLKLILGSKPIKIKHKHRSKKSSDESPQDKMQNEEIKQEKKEGKQKLIKEQHNAISVSIFREDVFEEPTTKNIIGSGSFAIVYKLKSKIDNNDYAIKILTGPDNYELKETYLTEFKILSQLSYPTILQFYGITFQYPYYIITEYIPFSLETLVLKAYKSQADENWNLTNKFIIVLGICLGMLYCHSLNFAHRDLKPGNVLIDSNFYPKICDFNLSTVSSSSKKSETVAGTIAYCAPEVLQSDKKYDAKKADVYSFGMTMYSILYDAIPFGQYNSEGRIVLAIIQGERPELIHQEGFEIINDLIKQCWGISPDDRPKFEEIKEILLKEKEKLSQLGIIEKDKVDVFLDYCNNI